MNESVPKAFSNVRPGHVTDIVRNKETPRLMLANENELSSLEELREYVYSRLCECDQLEPGIFPMTEHILVRGENPCGIHFCVHGPRSVKYTAIWETDRNSILFYGPTGERYHKTQLKEAPELSEVQA